MTKPRAVPLDPLDIALGQNIRSLRKQCEMSQSDLAKAAGVTYQQIQKYELGTNRVSFSRLVAIAHALGLRVYEVVGDIDVLPEG